jgi:hypothetical protein
MNIDEGTFVYFLYFVVNRLLLRCYLSFANPFIVFVTHLILEDSKPPAKRLKTAAVDERNEKSTIVESSDLIEIQKGRAIKRWKEANMRKDFNEENYNAVLDVLQKGYVPPIYHTLCREPAKRLFLPNTFVSNGKTESGSIKLSSEKVQPGQGTRSLKKFGDKSVWDDDEFSYLDAFFAKDGQGLFNVRDSYLKEDWVFNKNVTEIVTDLINTPAKMVGHDVEVTKLQSAFPLDNKNGRNLITRSLSRGVVADCFEHSEPGSTYAIVGSPGIGKSWSLIYALQQALLYENACVLFCFQKKGLAWVCIRKKHFIYAWRMKSPMLEDKCGSGLFDNGNVLVLLDPKESKDKGGASYIDGDCQLIFSASNNEAHFKNVYKDTPGYERILNPYSALELKIALKYMSPFGVEFSDDEVLPMLQLADILGNMPRYVISEDRSKDMSKKVKEYIQEIEKMDSVTLLKFLSFQGTTGVEVQDTIKGAIFSLYAAGSIDKDNTLVDVGYDGEAAVNYGERHVMFASLDIRRQIAIAQRGTLLSYDGKTADGLGSNFGHIVEDLFWMDMKNNIKMKVYKLNWEGDENEKDIITFYFGDADGLADRVGMDKLSEILFCKHGVNHKCRMALNCSLIDFAGPGHQVFQVTVSTKHTVNRQGVQDFLIVSGILEKGENGTLSYSGKSREVLSSLGKNPNLLQECKLKFYWVIPEGVSGNWKKKKPLKSTVPEKECKVQKKEKIPDLLNEAWKIFVDQYVAIMSPDLEVVEGNRKESN